MQNTIKEGNASYKKVMESADGSFGPSVAKKSLMAMMEEPEHLRIFICASRESQNRRISES